MDFDGESSFHFLPSLVSDHLLSYLDFYDRILLRLVSKTTKRWIETSEFLQTLEEFPDSSETIKSQKYNQHKHRNDIACQSNRLTINFKEYEDDPFCLEYIFGPNLRFLKLLKFTGQPQELRLISKCSNLESLFIETLDLTGNPELPELATEDTNGNFYKVLRNLEHFKVISISIVYPGGTELEYFGNLLKLLDNLKTLNIPSMLDSSGVKLTTNEDKDQLSLSLSINYGFVIGPVIKYISRRTQSNSHFQSEQLQNLNFLDLKSFELCYFELFPELIKICNKSGTQLLNVNFALIRKLIAMRYDTKLLKVVRSVQNKLVGNASFFQEMVNVQAMNLDCDRCEVYLPSDIGNLLLFPGVTEMELCIWSNTEFSDDESPVKDIVIKPRPKLRKLVLSCNDRCKLLVPMQSIVENFQNLTFLQCKTFPSFKDEDLIKVLRNLKKLQVLDIDDEWGGISDLGITATNLESGHLEILSLTALVKLRLTIRCKYTGAFYPKGRQYTWPWAKLKRFSNAPNSHFISDYCFKEVFRHLRLKSFLVESADINVTKLGYQHLLDGEFAETVQYFPLPEYLPTGLSEEEFYQLRNDFKHFKCSNLNKDLNYSDNLRISQDQSNCILS